MVRIDAGQGMILASDAASQGLEFLDASGRLLGSLPLGNIAVSLTETDQHWFIGAIGHFFPREEPAGQILRVHRKTSPLRTEPLVSRLPESPMSRWVISTPTGMPTWSCAPSAIISVACPGSKGVLTAVSPSE